MNDSKDDTVEVIALERKYPALKRYLTELRTLLRTQRENVEYWKNKFEAAQLEINEYASNEQGYLQIEDELSEIKKRSESLSENAQNVWAAIQKLNKTDFASLRQECQMGNKAIKKCLDELKEFGFLEQPDKLYRITKR